MNYMPRCIELCIRWQFLPSYLHYQNLSFTLVLRFIILINVWNKKSPVFGTKFMNLCPLRFTNNSTLYIKSYSYFKWVTSGIFLKYFIFTSCWKAQEDHFLVNIDKIDYCILSCFSNFTVTKWFHLKWKCYTPFWTIFVIVVFVLCRR